jgi:hypothetical protein
MARNNRELTVLCLPEPVQDKAEMYSKGWVGARLRFPPEPHIIWSLSLEILESDYLKQAVQFSLTAVPQYIRSPTEILRERYAT